MPQSNITIGLQKDDAVQGKNNISIGHSTGLDLSTRNDSIAIGNGCLEGEDGVWIGAASIGGPALVANATSVSVGHAGIPRASLGRVTVIPTDDAIEFHVGDKIARLPFEN